VRKGLAPKAAREACCCVAVARRAPEHGFAKYRAEEAVLSEQTALIREIGAIFHHLQKNALFERFFRLKLKQIRYSTPYIGVRRKMYEERA
jgi:hypothetical protein